MAATLSVDTPEMARGRARSVKRVQCLDCLGSVLIDLPSSRLFPLVERLADRHVCAGRLAGRD